MKNTILIFACALLILGCNSATEQKDNTGYDAANQDTAVAVVQLPERQVALDTITNLDQMQGNEAYFQDAEGRVYKVTVLSDETSEQRMASYCDTTIFLGIARRDAKTTKVNKTIQTYASLASLMSTLATDSFMRNHTPPITSDTSSLRVSEEKRNVSVTKAWLFAIKRESDNDFHLIISTDTTSNAAGLMNVEVSGLPNTSSTSYTTLKTVRDTISNRFGKLCKSSYTLFTPPMKIAVRGSLFYDIDHAPGIVGPLGYRPQTAWEIHPVTNLVFK